MQNRDSQSVLRREEWESERYQRELLSTQIQNSSSGTERLKGALDLGKYLLLLRNTRKAVEAAGACATREHKSRCL